MTDYKGFKDGGSSWNLFTEEEYNQKLMDVQNSDLTKEAKKKAKQAIMKRWYSVIYPEPKLR